MKKDFVTVTPDTGNGDKVLSFVADANSGDARETLISITGGISKSVVVNQAGGTLKNKAVQFIVTGGVFAGTIVADDTNELSGRRSVAIKLNHVIEANYNTWQQYKGCIGINTIDGELATQDELPTFAAVRYTNGTSEFAIEKSTLPANVYKPHADNEATLIDTMMKVAIIENGIEHGLSMRTEDSSCILSISFEIGIQAVDLGLMFFLGVPSNPDGSDDNRPFGCLGDSPFNVDALITFRNENLVSINRLNKLVLNNANQYDTIVAGTPIGPITKQFYLTNQTVVNTLVNMARSVVNNQRINVQFIFDSFTDIINLQRFSKW